jgi:hypothetical protein
MQEYDYMLLARLKMDCEYYIKTAPHVKHLWAGNVKAQIAKMKELWEGLKVKPQWLQWYQIVSYERQMQNA